MDRVDWETVTGLLKALHDFDVVARVGDQFRRSDLQARIDAVQKYLDDHTPAKEAYREETDRAWAGFDPYRTPFK